MAVHHQVCQSNDPSAKKKKKKKQQSAPAEKRNDAADDFFGGGEDNFFGGAFDDFEDEQSTSEAPAPADTLDGDHLPDHMFSNYDEFYYYEDDDAAGKTRQKRSALARHLPAKCVACETRHRKERPTPEQFRKHLRWFMEDNPGETCPVAGQAAYRDCLRLTQLKDTSDGRGNTSTYTFSFSIRVSLRKTFFHCNPRGVRERAQDVIRAHFPGEKFEKESCHGPFCNPAHFHSLSV